MPRTAYTTPAANSCPPPTHTQTPGCCAPQPRSEEGPAGRNEEALTAKMYVWFMDKTKADVLAAGLAAKVPVGVAMTPADLLAMPGLTAEWQRRRQKTRGRQRGGGSWQRLQRRSA